MSGSAIASRLPPRTGLQIQKDVVYALVLREVGSRLGKSRVGLLWVMVEPVAHLVFPIAMFGFLMARALPGIDYPVFLVYGFLPFLLFKTICLQTMEGVSANRGLLSYRQITLMDVFVAKAIAYCAIESLVFAVVLAGLAMLGFGVLPPYPVEFAGALALTVALGFGLGLLFAAIGSLVPDSKSIIRVLFLPLYLASGVLFPITRFPDQWIDWLALNPVLHLVELSRATAIEHYEPMRQLNVAFPGAVALVANFIGLAMYRLRYLSRVTM